MKSAPKRRWADWEDAILEAMVVRFPNLSPRGIAMKIGAALDRTSASVEIRAYKRRKAR